jgi:alanine racemase
MLQNKPISYIEISKKNLLHNFRALKKITHLGTEIAAVIKSNAYGHGQDEVAKILEPHADYFQVNSVAELELLRKVSRKKTFLLGYVQKSDLVKAIKLGCILSVFSLEQLKNIELAVARLNLGRVGKQKIKQEIHIPIDAHLGREGILENQWSEFFKEVKKSNNLKLSGIYAHFANIEDTTNFSHAKKQVEKYKRAVALAAEHGFAELKTHISATSGLLIHENTLSLGMKKKGENSIVRLGIGLYGLWPSEYIRTLYQRKLELKPVLNLKTKIAQVKTLPAEHTIGYGLTYKTEKNTKIAVIPVGYADGYDRGFSNIGEVLIRGTRCRILGRVAMNMFVVDVNHLKGVKAEEEVVLIGRQFARNASNVAGADGEENEITAEELAKKIDTINYEITTRLNPLLPRIVKN